MRTGGILERIMPVPVTRKEWEQGGERYVAEVSPCSWMRPGYGLQVIITKRDGSRLIRLDKRAVWAEAVQEDFDRLCAEPIELRKCVNEGCSGTQFVDPRAEPNDESNRRGECEKCFLAKIRAKYQRDVAKEKILEAKDDAKMRKQGMTHKAVAWVHPSQGDDRQVTIYFAGQPSDGAIRKALRKAGSVVLDDYTIVPLG